VIRTRQLPSGTAVGFLTCLQGPECDYFDRETQENVYTRMSICNLMSDIFDYNSSRRKVTNNVARQIKLLKPWQEDRSLDLSEGEKYRKAD
jgi:hypothetical protein